MEDIASKIGLSQMALIYKHYEIKGYPSKEYYVNRIKELRAKIIFTYILSDKESESESDNDFYDCDEEEELQDI